jgi:2-polyprenyl-3-methyl-5-hydroxy-6-metoxy-1,4-benzoquinol methylase
MSKHKVIADPEYGFLRLEQIPTQIEVEEFYAQDFYAANQQYFNNSALELQTLQKDFFDSRWERVYDVCKQHHLSMEGKTVFDIGFGFAQALLYFNGKGLEVSGIEPSKEGVDYAKAHGLSNVHHASIEDFNVAEGQKYDIILLLNVLEHLREPAKTLQNIKQYLMHENSILVIDVPNDFNVFQKVANAEYGLNEWWVLPPNHINYFSHSTLATLAEKIGYKIFKKDSSFPIDMFLTFGDVYIGKPDLGRECHNKRTNFENLMFKHQKKEELYNLYESLANLNIGRNAIVYATL